MLMDEYVAFSRGVQVTKMSSLSERRVPGDRKGRTTCFLYMNGDSPIAIMKRPEQGDPSNNSYTHILHKRYTCKMDALLLHCDSDHKHRKGKRSPYVSEGG